MAEWSTNRGRPVVDGPPRHATSVYDDSPETRTATPEARVGNRLRAALRSVASRRRRRPAGPSRRGARAAARPQAATGPSRRRARAAALASAAVVTLAAPAGADAAARTFANSYAQTLHGDIALIGNANSTCRAGWTGGCTPNALGNGNSNNSYGALVDVDGIPGTSNSSSSTLNLPAGAVVRSARLIWGSAGDGTDNNGEGAISFDTPATAGIAYTTIGNAAPSVSVCGSLANLAGSNTRGFACAADVTALVSAAGNGAYTLGGIEQRANSTAILPDHWSGWGLYVVYELASEPLRRLVLADGFQRVGAGAPTTITASGFVAPASGSVTARLSYMVGEGDSEISGDNATFGSRTLDTATTPNLMDSEIRGLDYQSTKNPNSVNHYGFDIHSDEVNGAIANGATTANFSFTSTQDVYYPFALGIAIDLGEPELVLGKTLTDVNGGAVEPGDIIEYQIVATNTGNDGAAQVTITDPIPPDTAYVPGSLQITAGPNAGNKTDAAGDDQGTFASNQVTMRLGTGATATAGGVLAANGGTSTMRFRVQIDNDADEGVPLVNTASGSYVGQTSLMGYADPSSVAATPVRRADMVVTQTPSAALTAGQAGSLTLTASNIGGASTHGQPVTVQTTLPAGVTFGSITSQAGWTCTTASLPTITCNRTDALAGGAAYPDIVIAVTPIQTATSVTFNSQVSGGNEVRTDNNADSDTVTILRSANLRVTKSVSAATGRVGDVLTYTLTATNLGPSNTTGVVVSDPLPSTLQPLTATTTAGSCSTAGQTVTCPVGALTNGASATITITARLLAASAGTTVVNGAQVTGADPDPTPGNNSATASTTVDQGADIRVSKTVTPGTTDVNGSVTWTVTVRNNGPGTATGISLTDDLPAGITVQSIMPSQGTCGTGDPFTCAIGTLANGASATVDIAARPGLTTAGTNITNTASATTTSFDPDTNDNTGGVQLSVNPAADLRVVKTADKPTANVDEDITWSVALTNLGPSTATGVTLTDNAPAGVAIQSVTPPAGVTCSTAGQTITCSTASLASGQTRTVSIVGRVARSSAGSPLNNSATGASSTFDPDTSNNLSAVTTNVNAAADLRVGKTADRATANVGDTIAWTVTATNDGASPATGVVLTDVLPAGVSLLTRTPSQGTCSVSGGQVICNLGGLAVGASATLDLTARVERAAAETPVQNVAQITGAQFDPDTANNSTNVTTTVGPATDLQITKSVDRASANVGDTVTYTLTARNDGPSTATGGTVTDTLPAGFTPSGTPTVTGGSCSLVGQALTCTLPSLTNGGVRSISVPGTVAPSAAGTTLTNTAQITGSQHDPDLTNNTSAAATTNVGGVANLAITKTVDRAAANVGDTLTYTLTVTNSGPQAATGVTVTDALPAGVSRLGATPSTGSCPAGSPIVCTLDPIPVGGSATVTITARVNVGAANATAVNSATVDATQDDLTPGNDTATASTTIAPAADLSISKTADRPTANVGETITWTLTATNGGPQSATGVTITDTIPSGVSLQTPITGLPSGVSCTVAGSVVSCPVTGAIANGSSVAITLRGTVLRAAAETPQQNTATVAGSQTDPNTANNSSSVTTNVNAAADLAVNKTVNTATANVGDTLTWTVAVTNTGPSTATGVQLIDDLPAGVTPQTFTTTGGSCTTAPTQLICSIATLPSGGNVTVTITARVERAAAELPVNNTARATATQFDPDTANNLATAATTIGPATDLRIAKVANRPTANVGDTIRYTLTATNDGPSAATGVVVSDTLPSTLARTGAIVASQGTCAQSGQTITCNVGALASGASATITLDAVVQASAAATTVANSATIAGAQLDPDPANNASPAASTAIAASAELALDLTVDRPTANVGDTLNYGFTLTNNGPSTATGITFTPTLPAGVQMLSSSVTGLTCSGSPVPTCTGSLANGASATGTLVVRVLSAASGTTVTANGTVTATTHDPISANNSGTANTTIAPAADLQLTKSVDRSSANIGDLLTYTLVGTNSGPANATGVTITDTLPSTLAIVGTPTSTVGTCTVAGQTVTCSPGDVTNPGSVTVTIIARLQASAAGQTVGNTATIDGDQHDWAPANDTSLTTSTVVGSAADLEVTQTVASPTVNVGGTATWTVRVRNNGPQTATSVALTDDVPAGVVVDSITPSQGTCGTGDPFTCALGTINSGADATVTIVGRITGAAETAFANTASATATQFDPNTSNNSATAAVSTNPAADLHIEKVADRTTADVGETITWTVTARNDGPSSATGVVITDTAPAGVTLQTPSGLPPGVSCSVAGQVVTCSRSGSLANGASVAITLRGTVNLSSAGTPLQNSATVGGDQFDPDTADNLSAVTTNVNAAADLRISKTADRPTANVGDTITWTVVATNDGPSTASTVVVTDDLPTGVTLLTNSATAGSCAPSGAQVVCTIPTLASGSSVTVTLTARVERSAAESPVANTARVTSSVFDPDTADNLSTASTTVGPAADLRLSKTVNQPTANVGDVLTYTLTATNDGPSTATGVTITDTLPSGLQITATPTASQGACTVTGQTVTCALGSIANGDSETATIQARVRPTASSSTLGNVATVTGTRPDPDPSNDSSGPPITTTIGAAADLQVTHSASPALVNVGDTAEWTITVRNNGPDTATGVVLSDDLPANTTLVSRTTDHGTCAATGDPLVCNLGALVPNETATITVRLRIDAGASATFTASATATATQHDPTPADNTASAGVSTGAASDLSLTKVADRPTADVGEQITWTLTAANGGPSPATGVVIADTVPAGITGVTAIGGAGVTCTVVGQAVSCAVAGTLPNGASRTVTLRGTVARSSAGSPLANSASVAGNEFDPDPSDNLSTATTNVNDAADLRIEKTADRPTAAVGDTITWTIAATNDGPSAASTVVVTDDLPTGITLLTATSTQGTCTPVGAQVSCAIGGLAPAQTVTATLTARVEALAAESPLVNTARITSTTFDPDTANNLSAVTTTVGQSIDLTTSAVVSRATADVGDELLYTFTVANAGPSTATGTTFTHQLPANTTYVTSTATQGGCAVSGSTLTCNLGALAASGDATVTVRVRIDEPAAGTTINARGTVSAVQPDRNPANDQSPIVSTAVAPAADLLVTVTADQPTTTVGGAVTYLVTVTNDGPSPATGVVLTNQLPAGATITSVTPSTGTCTPSGNPRTCALGGLAVNATATLTVVVQAETANAGALMTNQASVTADQFDPRTANNSAQASSAVGDAADLQITKTVDRATAEIGDTVTWTLVARNNGPLGATGVTVTDAIPAGVTITSASSTTSGVTCATGAPVTCSVGALANGASATITVVGTIGTAAAGQPLTGQATITGSQLDPNPANNVSQATTTVGPAADLRLTKVVDDAAPGIGDSVTWTIQVFNDGPNTASAVQVTDVVPAGAPIDAVSSSAGSCTRTGQSVTCALGSIPSGGSATVTIRATVATTAGGAVLDNAATASAATRDPNTANNTATARATAGAAADLEVAITPDRTSAVVGETVGWTAVVGNGGPQTATGGVVTLELPDGLADPSATVPGGSCTVSGRTVTCTIPNLAPGATATIALRGTLGRAAAERDLAVEATVTGALPDPVPTNNAARAAVVTVPSAVDLVVTKRTDKPSAGVGERVTITTDVLNRGPSTATDVTLTDTLPAGVRLESVTPSQGTCTVTGQIVTCNLGSLADGQTATVAVVVVIERDGVDQSLLNAGQANSQQFDLDGSNNSDRVSTTGVDDRIGTASLPKPVIKLTKVVDKTAVAAGDAVVWTLTATNTSNVDATGVRVTDQLPAGLDYVSTKVSGGTCTRNARTITCVVSRLQPDQSVTIKVTTRVAVAGAPIDNVANVTTTELPDPKAASQIAGARVRATGAPFVVAGIKPLEAYTRPGRRVRIAVKVTNVGQTTANGVRACFTLPSGVVLLRRPAGLTQKGAQFCLRAPSLAAGKNKRIVLSARVVGGAGTTRPGLTGTAANSRVKVERYPLVVRGARPTRAAGVTG